MTVIVGIQLFLFTMCLNSRCMCQEPCMSASPAFVIDICSSRTVTQESMYAPIVLKVSTMEMCHCELSVLNSIGESTFIYFSKYQSLSSSHPGEFGCGVALRFKDHGDTFWETQCIINNKKTYNLPKGHKILIETFNITGTLKNGKGYCIEIGKEIHANYSDHKLQLRCDSRGIHTSTSLETTSKANEEVTTSNSLMTNNSNTTMFTAIGAPIGGLVLVCLIVLAFYFRNKIFRKQPIYEDQEVRTFQTEESKYDDLSSSTNQYQNSSCVNGCAPYQKGRDFSSYKNTGGMYEI